jgi:NifU-like protein involved in Fe-S cluster formation
MYSQKVTQHFLHPHNVYRMEDATHTGTEGKAGEGNYMVIYLKVEGGRIVRASCQTYGCVGAVSSGCELADLVVGKSPEEALSITPEDVLQALGGLPLGKEHCAALAVGALRKALTK